MSQRTACCNPAYFCVIYNIYNPNPQFKIFNFLVDVLFYGALVAGIITVYWSANIISGRFRKPTRSLGEDHSSESVTSSLSGTGLQKILEQSALYAFGVL